MKQIKRYWTPKYEKEASEKYWSRKQEISNEVKAVVKTWSKDKTKKEIMDTKKLLTQAKTKHDAFSQVLRNFKDHGKKIINIYLKTWTLFGNKPSKAKVSFAVMLRASL